MPASAKIEGKELVIRVPLNTPPQISASGKSKACKALLNYVQDVGGSGQHEMMDRASAAIKKAEGQA